MGFVELAVNLFELAKDPGSALGLRITVSGSRTALRFDLRQLPELTGLEVQLSVPDLTRLMDERGDGALPTLQAAFPPKLQKLALWLPEAHSPEECQLLLDALSAMKELEELNILQASTLEPGYPAALSLKSLQQLPRLTHLGWKFMGLTVSRSSSGASVRKCAFDSSSALGDGRAGASGID